MQALGKRNIMHMRCTKIIVCAVVALNISVGIAVICIVIQVQQESFHPDPTRRSTAKMMKKHIDHVYEGLHQTLLQQPPSPEPTITEDQWNILRPIAFFTGLEFGDNKKNASTSTAVRNWVPFVERGRQYLYNGMKYENGSVVVPAAGIYVVYAHSKFYTETNRRSDPELNLNHSITRYNAVTEQTETVSRNTVTENKNNIIDGSSLEYSSDIHALVQLNAGDQLMVNVLHSELLKPDRDWHYFGAYII